MEAMGVETLLLSVWEEEGFIGRARVPFGQSDLDVLAFNPTRSAVRVGEAKVREGCNLVYPLDHSCLSEMRKPGVDFTYWLGKQWSAWLVNLPLLWDSTGAPGEARWLPALGQVSFLEVTFLCNVWVFGAQGDADDALAKAATKSLRKNTAIKAALDGGKLKVSGQVLPTSVAIQRLIRAIRSRICDDRYARRFGDPLKDSIRELNRFLNPSVKTIPCNAAGQRTATRKGSAHDEIRLETLRGLLDSLGVTKAELQALARP